MKILYLDCGMGAAGDMLTAALLDLLPDKEEFIKEFNSLGIPGVISAALPCEKCGIKGLQMKVTVEGIEEAALLSEHDEHHSHEHTAEYTHEHELEHQHEDEHQHHDHEHSHDDEHHHHDHEHSHHHSSMHDIEAVVSSLSLSDKVKSDVLAVYGLIAEAESQAHGIPVTEIHFHEVGTMDAVADITAVCLLMNKIAPDEVVVSPVNVGSGSVKCAHGILPVPAPAAAYILRDVPIYGGEIKSELCTPTGAALLKYFATSFGDMPVMRLSLIGYGMGKKDFERANCVRAMIGETVSQGNNDTADNINTSDTIVELSCNLDDMTAEATGFAEEQLFSAGALDVYTIPIQMKKSRPGTLLSVMCRQEDRDAMIKLIFLHTTTLGIRETLCRRYTLNRSIENVETPYGNVRKKKAFGYGVTREKYEYEDVAQIARNNDMSLEETIQKIKNND